MNKRRLSIWDALAWIVLFLILLWLILKVSGVINTSELILYSPLFGAVYLAGWAMHKLDTAIDDVKDLKNFAKSTINEINNIKLNCSRNHSKK